MNYRRLILLIDLEHDSRPAAALIRRVAPSAELLLVIARLAAQRFAWFSSAAPASRTQRRKIRAAAARSDARSREGVEVNLVPS